MKQFYNDKVEKMMEQAMGAKMEKPLVAVKSIHALVASAIAIVDGPGLGGVGADDMQAKHKESMRMLAEVDVETDLDMFQRLSFGDIAAQRAQCLVRVIKLVIQIAKMPDPLPMEANVVEQLGAFMAAKSALGVWVQCHQGIFDTLKQGWWGDVRTTEKVLKFAGSFEAKVKEAWSKHCAMIAETVMRAAPPSSLLENKKLLQDKGLQAALHVAAVGGNLGEKVRAVSHAKNILRSAEATGFHMQKQPALERARIHGKRSIGVDYAIKMLTNELPPKASDLEAHANRIISNLRQKGIGKQMIELPLHFETVFEQMYKAAAAAKMASAQESEEQQAAA